MWSTTADAAEWRLIFALSRFGGLRCPSEHLAIGCGDIDFEARRMTVRSPKTAHHYGKEFRVPPIFLELRGYLEKCRELAGYRLMTRWNRDHSLPSRS